MSYPYKAFDQTCNFTNSSVGARFSNLTRIPQNSTAHLLDAVLSIGPISVAIDAENDFQFYSGGIFTSTTCSETMLDHAVTVVDITESPYKVVAQYKNNQIAPFLLPNLLYAMATRYNNAYILTEVNDIGQEIVDIMHNEMEYENLLVTTVRGRKGQVMDGGFGNYQVQQGVRMSPKVKRVGCTMLKEMIEQDKLLIEDYDIINELSAFVAKKGSYEAETGHHDDLVMTLVLFAWTSTQPYFKDLTDINIREELLKEKIAKMEEDIMPFGFLEDGVEEDSFVDNNGDHWSVDKNDGFL